MAASNPFLGPVTTVAQQQKDHFQEQWRNWRNALSPQRDKHPLLSYTPVRTAFLRRSLLVANVRPSATPLVGSPLSGYSILDVGCGPGFMSQYLAALGARVHAIDVEPQIIEHNKTNNDPIAKSILYETASAESLLTSKNWSLCSFLTEWLGGSRGLRFGCPASEQYDIIVASEVLEHVQNPRLFLRSLDAMLKPEGLLLVTTPERSPLSRFILLTLGERVVRMIAKNSAQPKCHHHHGHGAHSQTIQNTHQYDMFVKARELAAYMQGRPIPRGPLLRCSDTCRQLAQRSHHTIRSTSGGNRVAEVWHTMEQKWCPVFSRCALTQRMKQWAVVSPLEAKTCADEALAMPTGKYVPTLRAGAFYLPGLNKWFQSDYLAGVSYLYSFKKIRD